MTTGVLHTYMAENRFIDEANDLNAGKILFIALKTKLVHMNIFIYMYMYLIGVLQGTGTQDYFSSIGRWPLFWWEGNLEKQGKSH